MLSFTQWVVRLLTVLNIVLSAILILMLTLILSSSDRFIEVISRQSDLADPAAMLSAARLILVLVVPLAIAAHLIFRRLLLILGTVVAGDPFSEINGRRLREIGYAMIAIQLGDLAFGAAGSWAEAASGERFFGWSPGLTGWVAVLLAFVLARVLQDGARMRDDLALTV